MMNQREVALKAFDEEDYKLALQLMLPLAEAGDVDIQGALGVLYQLGQGTGRDLDKAVCWLEKAALGGSGLAAWNLGTLYMTCEPDLPIDPEKSKAWRDKADELGISPFSVSSDDPSKSRK